MHFQFNSVSIQCAQGPGFINGVFYRKYTEQRGDIRKQMENFMLARLAYQTRSNRLGKLWWSPHYESSLLQPVLRFASQTRFSGHTARGPSIIWPYFTIPDATPYTLNSYSLTQTLLWPLTLPCTAGAAPSALHGQSWPSELLLPRSNSNTFFPFPQHWNTSPLPHDTRYNCPYLSTRLEFLEVRGALNIAATAWDNEWVSVLFYFFCLFYEQSVKFNYAKQPNQRKITPHGIHMENFCKNPNNRLY